LIYPRLLSQDAPMIDQPLLQIDQILLPTTRDGTTGLPTAQAAQPLSLDFSVGQFHLLAGENVAPLAQVLRLVAGYDPLPQGRLQLRGQPLAGVPLGARGIASVTADPRLFPQLTIGRNILFPLSGARRIGDTATAVAGAALRVGLSAAALDRYPDEISLAMQLRAALARALALGPSLLLLTDPLHDLPAADAASLLQDLRRLQRDLSLTVICASDRLPVWAPIADRITLLETAGGRLGGILQSGTAEDIYLRPESRSAARLSGAVNLLPVEILARNGDMLTCRSQVIDPMIVDLPQRQVASALMRSLPVATGQDAVSIDATPEMGQGTETPETRHILGEASLLLRPSLLRPGLGIRRQDFRIEGRVQDRFSDGATVTLQVNVPGLPTPIIATMPAPTPFPLEKGMAVSLGWNRGDMRLLPIEARSVSAPGKDRG
jgi:ABC-type Fe3+/spermidine/putrescine transport system ATPase subunit